MVNKYNLTLGAQGHQQNQAGKPQLPWAAGHYPMEHGVTASQHWGLWCAMPSSQFKGLEIPNCSRLLSLASLSKNKKLPYKHCQRSFHRMVHRMVWVGRALKIIQFQPFRSPSLDMDIILCKFSTFIPTFSGSHCLSILDTSFLTSFVCS